MGKHAWLTGLLILAIACGDDDGAGTDAGGGSDAAADSGSDSGGGASDSGATDSAVGMDSATDDAGADDAGADDAGADDAGADDDAGSDAAVARDAGPLCEGNMPGRCTERGTSCLSCPAGGPLENYLCTTACRSDADCTSRERPDCNQMNDRTPGICAPRGFRCAWGAICASPDTPIATPEGERAIAELREGDLVFSVESDQIVAVPIALVGRTRVVGHEVMRVELDGGQVLEISGGHPTADGELFADLEAGDHLGEFEVVSAQVVPYTYEHTYDILPASETGTYFAAGAWIGSTLQAR
ncbi:MAG: Hint domain-containing protein [Myxococcota bacterium]